MLRWLTVAVLIVLLPVTAANAAAQRIVTQIGPLSVSVHDGYRCQVVIQACVTAPHKKFFQGEMSKVKTIAHSALETLSKECPRIGKIEIVGLVNQRQVYSGNISITNNWILTKDPIWEKTASVPRASTAGIPYMNTYNELVVYDSGPIIISSPFKSRLGRLKLFDHVDTVDGWCKRKNLQFILEYDCDLAERNSYFAPGFEKFFLDKIFPTIKSLCEKSGSKHQGHSFTFFMRKRNETDYWDNLTISVRYKPHSYEIKSLRKRYSLMSGRKHITGKERVDLSRKMNRRWLINPPGEEIYEDDFIRIYPHHNGEQVNHKIGMPGWCEKPELNIVYKMPIEERDKMITFEYLSPLLFKIAKQHCSAPAVVTLYFYPENEDSFWDMAEYQYCRLANINDTCRTDNTKFEYGSELGRSDGPLKTVTLVKKYRKNPYYLWECDDGIFCDLPGGKYLTAIYEKDLDTIKEMDSLAHRELIGALRGWQTKTGLWQVGLDLTRQVKPVSLLLEVANQYMYHYRFNNRECLQSNAVTKTYTYTAETIRYENLYGMDMGSVGGWTAQTTYTVNPEFYPLLVRLGKFSLFSDVEVTAKYLKLRGLERTAQDVKALQKNFNCNSLEIKRFEKNLIELATMALNGKLRNSKPSGKASSPKRQKETPEKSNDSKASISKPIKTGTATPQPSVKKRVNERPERFINGKGSIGVDFPDELVLSPLVNDFLLARYYPDLLSQRMLEAMVSSRWSYESSQNRPLGGRFFRPGTRPEYKDIQRLTPKFREWLTSRAKALPEALIVEIPLEYGRNTMWVNNTFLKLVSPDNAPVRMSQAEKERRERDARQCEERNRRLAQHFKSCEKARQDLEQARRKLARANASGCLPDTDGNSGINGSGSGPCKIPGNLTMANMKEEMMKCLTSACGTPSDTTDMMAYQKCAQAVSEQFRNEIIRRMGQKPEQPSGGKENACQAAEKEIQTIEQHLASFRCDLIPEKPELFDCSSMGEVKQPEFMPVERIEFSHMQPCTDEIPAYNRRAAASAELLPGGQPLAYTNYNFILLPDKLSLPYDSPYAKKKGETSPVKARITVRVKEKDCRFNRRSQYGLTVKVDRIDFLPM